MIRRLLPALLAFALTSPAFAGALDHGPFDALLQKHVHGQTVDYAGFAGNASFEAYVKAIAATDPKSVGGPKAQLAFWINAYNALTIHSVVQHWPGIKSVTDVKPDFGFFKVKDKTVGGKAVSLNQIENEIIRPTFKDPRVHAALNCASVSCPPLFNRAFTASALDAQLDQVMQAFIRDPRRNIITADGLQISEIFNWYKADFAAAGGVKAFLAKHLEGAAKQQALSASKITFLKYNWSLNAKR